MLTASDVHIISARSSALRGWRVTGALGTFARGSLHAAEVGRFFELSLDVPGQLEHLSLVPSHPTPVAAEIASVLHGPKTLDAPEPGRWDPWWVR